MEQLYEFLMNNKGMVLYIARRVLINYKEEEVMSEAYLMAHEVLKDKRDPFRNAKEQSVLWNYLYKGFLKKRETVGYMIEEDIPSLQVSPDAGFEHWPDIVDESFSPEEFLSQAEGDGSPCEQEHTHTLHNKFFVCTSSFQQHACLSSDGLQALCLLSHQAIIEGSGRGEAKIEALKRLFGCDNCAQLRQVILLDIIRAVAKAGSSIYRATCKNGARNTVLVCAPTADEASSFLGEKYGEVLDLGLFFNPAETDADNIGCTP
jgi:hypothetical protein